jgi:hypothetical protein
MLRDWSVTVNSVALDLPALPDDNDLVPSKTVRKEYGNVSQMTIWRWRNSARVQFPPPDVVINERNYWKRRTLRLHRARIVEVQQK